MKNFVRLPASNGSQYSHLESGVYMLLYKSQPMYCGESNMVGRRVYKHLWQLSKDGTVFTGSGKSGKKLTDKYLAEYWEVVLWQSPEQDRKLLEFKLHLKYKSLKGTGTAGMNAIGYIVTYKGESNYTWNLKLYAEANNLNLGHVYSVANGNRKTHKGHTIRRATYKEATISLGIYNE